MGDSAAGRERWASRIGLVLAMAGNAIGLGNFLRFPSLAAQYGGGAFMVPYAVALLLLGIPLMWVEWTMGRYGGQFGHSTTPGMFQMMWRSRWAKYVGSLGISLPLLFVVFYTYIESWTLAYSYFSVTQAYFGEGETAGEIAEPVSGVNADSLRAMLAERDADRDGVLTREEWSGPAEAFAQLDADGNGRLGPEESQRVLAPLAKAHTNQFLRDYQGVSEPEERRYFQTLGPVIAFWLVTVALNCWIISRGISSGIERLAKVAMPALFLFAIVLVVRVLTYTPPGPPRADQTVWAGLNYVWEPNLAALGDFNVWLMAAGQIFFTLSIGTGTIQCYASYLRKDEDCALTGLTTATTNEFAEVILGGTIAIPIAVATFGLANTQAIAGQGTFNLGFVAMPVIFEQMPAGWFFGMLWFLLLFFAGITSSVALSQPLVAFLQDEFGVGRRAAAVVCGAVMIVFGLPIVLWMGTGYLGQYDFWVGTFGLAIFSLVEVLIFGWAFGGGKMWAEMQRGADIRIPRAFYYIIRYVAPVYLLVLLGGWFVQEFDSAVLLSGVPAEDRPYLWLARGTILATILALAALVAVAWGRRTRRQENVR